MPGPLQLPDGSVSLPGFRGAWFLFRQPWMLGPAVLGTIGWMAWVLALSIQNDRATLENVLTLAALSPVVGFGVAALTGLFGFFLYRALTGSSSAWEPEGGEALVSELKANHVLGDEGRGGRLFVTDRRIVFVPHRFNVQLATCEVALGGVQRVAWSRVVNPMGTPLAEVMLIETERGTDVFVVPRAQQLAERIEQLRGPAAARDALSALS